MAFSSLHTHYLKIKRLPASDRPVMTQVFFETQVMPHPETAEVVEFCLWVLENLTEHDTTLEAIYAAQELARRADTSSLPRLQAIRPQLPFKTGVRDYRHDVDTAISVLENLQNPCACEVAASFRHPPKSVATLKILQTENPDPYLEIHTAQCEKCQRTWLIRQEEGYHYPQFDWREKA